jgi:hypothetical protein
MSVIGVITCEVLEQEIAYLLAADPELEQVVVLEDLRSMRLIEELRARQVCGLQCIPHMARRRLEPSRRLEALVRVLGIGLHRGRKILQRALHSAAQELAPHVDVLLLGYGLCGNALADVKAVLDVDVPVIVPMDCGQSADDCVALLLGGRDRYCEERRKAPGTFFMTPGWSCHWKGLFADSRIPADGDAGRRIFARYTRSLLITTPVLPEDTMRRNTEEFNAALHLSMEACPGTLDILAAAWTRAKTFATAAADNRAEVELTGV